MSGTGDFFYACGEEPDLEYVKENLDSKDVRINKLIGKKTSLYAACLNGNAKIVEVLIGKKDIDVNKGSYICQGWGASFSENYTTPLYVAVENGHIDVVKVLLAHEKIDVNKGKGIKVSDKDDNKTPLHVACEKNNKEIVILLLLHKKIKYDNKYYGKTPDRTGQCSLEIKKLFKDFKTSKLKFRKAHQN